MILMTSSLLDDVTLKKAITPCRQELRFRNTSSIQTNLTHLFPMHPSSRGRERVHWEQMGQKIRKTPSLQDREVLVKYCTSFSGMAMLNKTWHQDWQQIPTSSTNLNYIDNGYSSNTIRFYYSKTIALFLVNYFLF